MRDNFLTASAQHRRARRKRRRLPILLEAADEARILMMSNSIFGFWCTKTATLA